MTEPAFPQLFPLGEPNDAFTAYFDGRSWNAPIADGAVAVNNITFEPACRNHWHVHHGTNGGGDQVLLCTAGSGWYQAEGDDPISLIAGSAVRVPAGTKHWHGAKQDSWFSHLAFITPGDDVATEWLEAVADDAYNALPTDGPAA
jgi:quercetin dioxygenase-like cupin family protein